jgi:hypothetical protein
MTSIQNPTTCASRRIDPGTNSRAAGLKGDSKALSPEQLSKIASYGSALRIPLKSLEDLRATNLELRERLADLTNTPPPTFFARCASWVSALFGANRQDDQTLRTKIEAELAQNITQIKLFTEKVIQPKVDTIRRQFEGKTFVRTKDTPEALVLAGVPTEKIGKIPSHGALISSVKTHVEKANKPNIKISDLHAEERITLSRRNKDGEIETLRISYRRPGKVDVELNGPNGLRVGSFWNDDAQKLAKAFTAGFGITIKPAKFKNYTVA